VNDQEKKEQIFRIFEVSSRHDIDGLDEYLVRSTSSLTRTSTS